MTPAAWFHPLTPAWPFRRIERAPDPSGRADTKTGRLLQHLRENAARPVSTLVLCHVVEVESKVVWGLLKNARAAGLVSCSDGRWSINPNHDEQLAEEVRQAAALLRKHGWNVAAPKAVAVAP